MKRIVVSLLVAMIAITTAVAQKPNQDARKSVSYTHLTLPTKLEV
mgnify:CR=1 FL=1